MPDVHLSDSDWLLEGKQTTHAGATGFCAVQPVLGIRGFPLSRGTAEPQGRTPDGECPPSPQPPLPGLLSRLRLLHGAWASDA